MVLGEKRIKNILDSLVDIERSEGLTYKELLNQVNPASIDLTIGAHYLRATNNDIPVQYGFMDAHEAENYKTSNYWEDGNADGDYIVLKPHDAILAVTREYIQMPSGVCGQIFTKSTLGRMFINHMMAGFVDPSFHGRLTLELVNDGKHTIYLPVGARIVQMILSYVIGAKDYNGRYQGAEGLETAKPMRE